jgi:hypothetical protein
MQFLLIFWRAAARFAGHCHNHLSRYDLHAAIGSLRFALLISYSRLLRTLWYNPGLRRWPAAGRDLNFTCRNRLADSAWIAPAETIAASQHAEAKANQRKIVLP